MPLGRSPERSGGLLRSAGARGALPESLPEEARDAVLAYLAAAYRVIPGAVAACAVTGSTALGAYRPGRSDIDLLVVLDDAVLPDAASLLARLRALHVSQVPRIARRLLRGQGFSATCNPSFVPFSQLRLPVEEIRPLASHTGELFAAGRAFDVNPVMWAETLRGGIVVRGPALGEWGLRPPGDARIRAWTQANLRGYWSTRLETVRRGRGRLSPQAVEWCVLGPARMHATVRTGAVLSKEGAGEYAAREFPVHRAIIGLALAQLRRPRAERPAPSETRVPALPPHGRRRELTADCMEALIADALEPFATEPRKASALSG